MKLWIILCALFIFADNTEGQDEVKEKEEETEEKPKLSEQIRAILEHYKQEDPVGLPGSPIPDPMPIPDMKHSFSVATMHFKNVKVYELSKFRIEHIRSNVADMQVSVGLRIAVLEIKGNYTMSSWFSRSQGRFTVTLNDVYIEGVAKLEVEREGRLQAQNIEMDITFRDITVNFQNLGFMASIFQGIINSVGSFLFDSIKPFILSEVNTNIRDDVNKHISSLPQRFPNSISPFDMAVAELRLYVREEGYDPYHLPNYNYTAGLFRVDLTHTWAFGLSSFHRVGNVTVIMEENVAYISMHVGTQALTGRCIWEVSAGGLLSRSGTASFTIEYIQVEAEVSQPLDTRKKPMLENLDIKLGNIQLRMDGAGTIDYILEIAVNVLPNLLRYQIVNALETPIKTRAQEIMDSIDLQELIDEHLSKIDELEL